MPADSCRRSFAAWTPLPASSPSAGSSASSPSAWSWPDSPTCASRRTGEVSVPEGARAGQLTLKSCDYGTEDGDYEADCGTLVVPENRARSRFAAHRTARNPHPRPLGASARAHLPARGRSRHHEHEVHAGEPLRREPRRGARRLPRRRGLRRFSTAPRSRTRCGARATSSASDSLRDQAAGVQVVREAPRRTRASTSRATRCPSEWTTSRRRARRSGTTRSTSSARAPAPARR